MPGIFLPNKTRLILLSTCWDRKEQGGWVSAAEALQGERGQAIFWGWFSCCLR